ncbi:transcriptional repressor TCF25-domain-containing protein [Desarmillaria tabescens]|uniref:Transcriptional repressor TCF25-domain-containing protein n=1 Tax=Armillaria tabescens TaxID=1929756 RepID=A0AA39N327_ARMTA|nr:transcriptional repressor TCF25-domain-containing protein [Desarmillaria tabescens]KAK0455688.1 transcriptional repressor TCF25-domain-containing protein [Desarmillaria tabescens]
MPPRLSKRQQRELEELEALGGSSKTDNFEYSEEEETAKPTVAGFAALFDPADDEDDGDDLVAPSTKSKKSKKKKKAPAAAAATIDAPPKVSRSSTPTVRNEKKAAKKAKAKARKADKDELDEVLAELSLKYSNAPSSSGTATQASVDALASLLSVSLSHLDSEAEMRKFFGSKVVQASKADTPGATSSSRRQPTALRSHLTRPQPAWAQARTREGLSIRPLTDGELKHQAVDFVPGEKWWTVGYSKKYKSMTKVFIQTVQAGDPQGLFDMCRSMPWHADTLLQMAQVFRHREEHSQAVDFIDRALFAYERSFIGAFTFTSGLNRLAFDFVENRPFFLALHRQAADLQRRGCLRTAFEFARLMYSLDPWNDPHGALYHLDYLAFKGNMTGWLLEMFDLFKQKRQEKGVRINPSILPGWMYARALALRVSRDAKQRELSAEALIEAVKSFPSVVPVLADKLEVSLSASIRGHRDFRIETDGSSLKEPVAILHLLSHLYVQRSLPVWKDHAEWFNETVTTYFSKTPLPSSLPITNERKIFSELFSHTNLQYTAYRHVMVLEYRNLFRYIPREILARKSLDCDPLPPPTAVTNYDEAFFEGVDINMHEPLTRRRRQAQERRLAQIVPDANTRAQIEALMAAPQVAAMFPGGVVQFLQAFQDLPQDLLDNLQDIMVQNEAGMGMPGGMPGEIEVEWADQEPEPEPEPAVAESDNDEDEDEDSEEDIAPMTGPFRMFSNWVGSFWGRNNAAEASESDSDEEQRRQAEADID